VLRGKMRNRAGERERRSMCWRCRLEKQASMYESLLKHQVFSNISKESIQGPAAKGLNDSVWLTSKGQ
jgi:hypothetical protein